MMHDETDESRELRLDIKVFFLFVIIAPALLCVFKVIY